MVLRPADNLPQDEKSSATMERYQVILAYDGSHYKGFQRQGDANSVQAAVEDALRKLSWQGKSILAAGRTDTGVHATGQVIAFDLDWNHELHELQSALNAYLPQDVVATEVRQVRQAFHPRYDASWRKYCYRIYYQPVRQPLLEPYAWRIWPALELEKLQESAQLLVGEHDFGAFGTPPHVSGSTWRVVYEAEWMRESPYTIFEITGQAFLYHMVRRVVFMQVSIAQGKRNLPDLKEALETGVKVSKDRIRGIAPAQGLILSEVHYPPEALWRAEDTSEERI